MPPIPPSAMIDHILDAIRQSGGTGAFVSDSVREHPRRFVFEYNGQVFSLWVYIWTLTHGGRPALPNEYRIQMTSVESPLPQNTGGLTALLGYEPNLGVFAGFDLSIHSTFTEGSPSVQIDIRTARQALQDGIALSEKDNNEIAIGIRPDHLLAYIMNSAELHRLGVDADLLGYIQTALSSDGVGVSEEQVEQIDREERQRLVTTVQRYSRCARFARQVVNAYESRCAITRAQLRLVEAAHIIPVAIPTSPDHVTNGVALSPTFHKAFDNSLVYLDNEYKLRLNDSKVQELRDANLIAGLDYFESLTGERIHLPADPNQWPNPQFIEEANRVRRIPGF